MATEASYNRSRVETTNLLVAKAFAVFSLLSASFLIGIVSPALDRLPLVGLAICALYILPQVVFSASALVAFLAMGIAALPALQLIVFSQKFGTAVNWNAAYSYITIITFCAFYMCRKQLDELIGFVARVSIAYCVIYVLISLNLNNIPLPPSVKTLGGDQRGLRLIFAMSFGSIALFYSLAKLAQGDRSWPWLLSFAVSALAFALSGSRTILAFVAIALLIYMVRAYNIYARVFLSLALLSLFVINISGLFVLDWNIFSIFASDNSGVARSVAYTTFRPFLEDSFFVGMGLASDAETFSRVVGREWAFWEDLGPFGVWLSLGLAGLLYFACLALLCINGPRRNVGLDYPARAALALSGLAMGLYAAISPTILVGDGTIVSNAILATWLMSSKEPPSATAARIVSRPS